MSRKALLVAGLFSAAVAAGAGHALAGPRTLETNDKEALFAFFASLEGSEWRGEGDWAGGGRFEQVHRYEWALEGRLLRSFTLVPDSTGTDFVPRAEGVRAWDDEADVMRFWEFDRFGGITEGRVGIQDGAVFYEYPYTTGGETRTLRDEWREAAGGYEYRVGVWEDGAWGQTYLEGTFTRRDPARGRGSH